MEWCRYASDPAIRLTAEGLLEAATAIVGCGGPTMRSAHASLTPTATTPLGGAVLRLRMRLAMSNPWPPVARPRATRVGVRADVGALQRAGLWRGLVDQDAVPEVAVVLGGELL